jgi:hypothetical protein
LPLRFSLFLWIVYSWLPHRFSLNVYLQYLPLTWHLPVESLLLPWRGMLQQLVCYLHNFLTCLKWKKNTWFKIPEINQSAKRCCNASSSTMQ